MSAAKPLVRFNVLAKNIENARQILEETDGNVLIGLMVKSFPSVSEAVETINAFQQANIPVSVGLGDGDPAQWKKVADVAAQTKPVHVNQIFPAAGYTLACLQHADSSHTIVNALIAPSGIPGKVIVSTGPHSRAFSDPISCDAAAAMLADVGVTSVKFFPIQGTERLDEVEEMVRAAVRQKITIFEPTGGINVRTIGQVIEACLQPGVEQIIPHVYTAIVDKTTGYTRLEDIRALRQAVMERL
ncbi:KDGP aldolase [Brevibacillus migulae]|uniref:KDGP aldolase n=1 Tax=Brevibacillus migulae TaxID=1644114 RepID=UPI00106DD919|nr:KDGP aldolase [Brevibacillus migulae]